MWIIKKGPGHKNINDGGIIRSIINCLESDYKPGLSGLPFGSELSV